jgi:hypothetical protein
MKESPQALRAFSDYLAQKPPRSLERLAECYQSATKAPPPTRRVKTLKDWSRHHHWQQRIREYERRLAQEREQEEADARAQAREARLDIADRLMSDAYNQFMAKAQAGKLTPSAALRALTLAFETQRRDLGEADQPLEVVADGGTAIGLHVLSVDVEAS